jgi:hypothetical protein
MNGANVAGPILTPKIVTISPAAMPPPANDAPLTIPFDEITGLAAATFTTSGNSSDRALASVIRTVAVDDDAAKAVPDSTPASDNPIPTGSPPDAASHL